MPSAHERKALWFLALVALSGSGVRLWRAGAASPPTASAEALSRQIARVDSARARRPEPRAARQPKRGRASDAKADAPEVRPPVDLDRADAAEIEALPGIGPALAGRVIQHRDSAGSFGSLEALCAVRGVGPVLIERLRPLVTFSGARRPVSVMCGEGSKAPRKGRASQTREPR
jgi:DNA uptake protein ComE-like DNA-binding protein